jgi:DNA invertase Pin-like site-specific DNA recombinase
MNPLQKRKPIGRPMVSIPVGHVIELRTMGLSWRQIARRLGLPVTTMRRACRQEPDTSSVCQNPPAIMQ